MGDRCVFCLCAPQICANIHENPQEMIDMESISKRLCIDDALYTLITQTNLSFVVDSKKPIRFVTEGLIVQYNESDDQYAVKNAIGDVIKLDFLDTDMIRQHYVDGIEGSIVLMQNDIVRLHNKCDQCYDKKISKDIANILQLNHDDLVVFGGDQMIFVSDEYKNKQLSIHEIKHPLLARYIQDNNMNDSDITIMMLQPDIYKSLYPFNNL